MEDATKDATTSGASSEIVPSCGGQHDLKDLLAVWSKAMITCASTTTQACVTIDELAAKQSWVNNAVKPGTADYVSILRQMTPEEKQHCKELESPSVKEQFRHEWNVAWRNTKRVDALALRGQRSTRRMACT